MHQGIVKVRKFTTKDLKFSDVHKNKLNSSVYFCV